MGGVSVSSSSPYFEYFQSSTSPRTLYSIYSIYSIFITFPISQINNEKKSLSVCTFDFSFFNSNRCCKTRLAARPQLQFPGGTVEVVVSCASRGREYLLSCSSSSRLLGIIVLCSTCSCRVPRISDASARLAAAFTFQPLRSPLRSPLR